MMFRLFFLLNFIFLGVLSASVDQKCKLGTPCSTRATNDLFKSILRDKKEELEPIYQEVIEANLATVKYFLRNTTTACFTKCDVTQSSLNLQKSAFEVTFYCPELHLKGLYEADGSILTVPVTGNGDYTIDTKAYDIKMKMGVKVTEKNNKHYMHIDNFKFELEPLGEITYNLTNLFNGQKDLGDNFLKFINTNSIEVAKLLQEPVFNANFRSIAKVSNKFLKEHPLEEFLQL